MSVLVMATVAAVAFGIVTALIIAVAYPWLRPRLHGLPGRLRAQLVMSMLAAPLLAAFVLSALVLLPGLVSLVWPVLDHCINHDHEHFHLCILHTPTLVDLGVSWALIVAALLFVSIGLGHTARRVHRGHRLLRHLQRTARGASSAGYAVADSEAPLALTAGLRRPQVFVTTGLLRDIDSLSQRAILAHETAHVHRRDPLRKLLAELLAAAHVPGIRRMLLGDMCLACEEACDDEAALAIGDRTVVAMALVRLSRLAEQMPARATPLAARFGDTSIGIRVQALLDPPKRPPIMPRMSVSVVAAVVVTAVLMEPLHHVTEMLLGSLLG